MEPPPREPSPPGTSPPEHDQRSSPPSPSQSSSSPLGTRRSSPRSPSLSFFFSVLFSNLRSHYKLCDPRGRPLRSSLLSSLTVVIAFCCDKQPGGFYSGRLRFLGPPFSGSPKGHFNKKRGNLPCASPARLISFFFSSFFRSETKPGWRSISLKLCSPETPKKRVDFPS